MSLVSFQVKVTEVLACLSAMPLKAILFISDIIVAALLFIPGDKLSYLGLADFSRLHQSGLGLSFLIISACWVVLSFCSIVSWIRFGTMYEGRDARCRIDQVSNWGKALIRQMYESPSRSLKLPLQDGNVAIMIRMQILTHANLGDAFGFECVLQPWVVEFLSKNPDYLTSLPKFDKPYKSPSRFGW